MTKETTQDIKEEAKTQPHIRINPKISAFLKEYKNNRGKVVEEEIKKRKELAISLLKELKWLSQILVVGEILNTMALCRINYGRNNH